MTNAILKGKPYAGSPHVRFDEGEVASEKPRRGFLLYKTPTKRTAHRLVAVLSLALAFATGGASAAENLYWTGATSTDYNTAGNWSANVSPVGTTQWYHTYDTAHIQSYRIDIAGSYGTRGGWWINAGTENGPVQFYCEKASQGISPNYDATKDYASYLNVADKSDAWAWFNGGKYDKFKTNFTIGSESYAGHITIGNDRSVATIMNFGEAFYLKNGTVNILDDATLSIGGNMVVGQIDSRKGTLTIDGGSCSADKLYIGDCAGATGDVVVNSGNMSIRNNLLLGQNGTGTLTINGGTFEVESGRLAYVGKANGTITLNSGKLIATDIQKDGDSGVASLVFNGGTLAANGVSSDALIRSTLPVTVGVNGGTIDAAGYNVTIAADLGNAAGETGAMTFKGGGTVTLSGAINYTGGTTVEAGTVVVVPDVSAATALGAITVTGLENTICEVVRLSGEGTFSAGNLPADTETVTFAVSPDGKSILAANGLESPFWIGGSGDLSTAANWSDGVVPTENPTIKWASPITLTNSGDFAPNTLTIPDDSAVVTLAGALTVNGLTNASRLAVASTGSLTVTGDLVATVESKGGSQTFLHSNEGTVTVGGKAIGYTNVGGSYVFEYAAVTENTRPIQARGIAYKCGGSGQLNMKLQSDGKTAGSWVVGADGFSFPSCRNANYTTFFAESAAVTLYSADNWTLANSTKNVTTRGDLYVSDASGSSLAIDTSDYVTPETRRTVTLKGRIVAYNPVTIKGCGTVVVDTTGSSTDDSVPEDFRHTFLTNSATLYVTDTATLQVNAGKKITGNGTISLAAGTTLALASTGREFATPEILPVTLPTGEGEQATVRIDGDKLRGGVDYVLFETAPTGWADHLKLDGSALDGRKTTLKEEGGRLLFNIEPRGLMLMIK